MHVYERVRVRTACYSTARVRVVSGGLLSKRPDSEEKRCTHRGTDGPSSLSRPSGDEDEGVGAGPRGPEKNRLGESRTCRPWAHVVWDAGEGRAPGRPLDVGPEEGLAQEWMLGL